MKNISSIFILITTLVACSIETEISTDGTAAFKANGKVQGTVSVLGEAFFFGTSNGKIYSLDTRSMEELWSIQTSGPVLSEGITWENSVLFSSGNDLFSIDQRTGEILWKHESQDSLFAGPQDLWDYHQPAPRLQNNIVFAAFGNGTLRSFDARSGAEMNSFQTVKSAAIRSTPVTQGNKIYFGDWNGRVYALDTETFDTIWTHETYSERLYPTFGQLIASFAIQDSVLVFGSRNPELRALNTNTGELMWSYTDPDGGWISGDPLISGDTLFIGCSDCHKLFAFDLYDGTLFWEYEFLFNNFSKPVITGNHVLFTTGDAYSIAENNSGTGYLYAIDRWSGKIKNLMLFPGNVFTSPTLTTDHIYIGSNDSSVYQIGRDHFLLSELDPVESGYKAFRELAAETNPFVDSTLLSTKITGENEFSFKILNLEGKEVRSLFTGKLAIGKFTILWDGTLDDGSVAPAGYYSFEARAGIYLDHLFLQKQ